MRTGLNAHLFEEMRGLITVDEPLHRYTSYGIGGPAKFFAEPKDSDELTGLLLKAQQGGLPVYVLGGGSNLLINDCGIEGLVIRMNRMRGIFLNDNKLHVGAGYSLPGLVKKASNMGLVGFSRFAGIPGQVGGMIRTNSGGRHGTLADILHSVKLTGFNGVESIRHADEFEFGHRCSNLADEISTELIFNVERGCPAELNAERREIMKSKTSSQPLSDRNAGCCFRNPPDEGVYASKLIDECGLKGFGVGGAVVSSEHANFICNEDNATASDVRRLIDIVQDTVLASSGYELKQEIIFWP